MARPVKVLLVPGHDDQVWGAQYGNLKEADMNLALATRIYNILKKDKRFQVWITRESGGYTKEFADYFANQKKSITAFKEEAKKKTEKQIEEGEFEEKDIVFHNRASSDVALKLYGINKWADENDIDAVIHIHFNDYPRENRWLSGKYKGFAIYTPDPEFSNSESSFRLAHKVFQELKKKYTPSNYPPELGGLVLDQKLIAVGANNTLFPSVRAILIEYGYIYRFGNSARREMHYTNMANLTATGVKNYFFLPKSLTPP